MLLPSKINRDVGVAILLYFSLLHLSVTARTGALIQLLLSCLAALLGGRQMLCSQLFCRCEKGRLLPHFGPMLCDIMLVSPVADSTCGAEPHAPFPLYMLGATTSPSALLWDPSKAPCGKYRHDKMRVMVPRSLVMYSAVLPGGFFVGCHPKEQLLSLLQVNWVADLHCSLQTLLNCGPILEQEQGILTLSPPNEGNFCICCGLPEIWQCSGKGSCSCSATALGCPKIPEVPSLPVQGGWIGPRPLG